MNINEMEQFSIEELENFTIKELKLSVKRLLKKVQNDNRPLPYSIFLKLFELCSELPEDVPKPKKGLTILEACSIITVTITYFSALPNISEKYSTKIQEIIEMIMKLL